MIRPLPSARRRARASQQAADKLGPQHARVQLPPRWCYLVSPFIYIYIHMMYRITQAPSRALADFRRSRSDALPASVPGEGDENTPQRLGIAFGRLRLAAYA